jgi:RNA polymerase sigma-70 factor, ECF subfamily
MKSFCFSFFILSFVAHGEKLRQQHNKMNSETDIIQGLKEGRESAYKYIYDRQYKVLCIIAKEYVNDTFTSEMIVSDVIFALWKNREELEINQSLRNYLIKAVRNRCLNYLSQSELHEHAKSHIGSMLEKEQINYENQHNYPLSSLLEKELDIKIENSIGTLPELTRRIFCLSRFNNLKYDEIAREINVSVDVVKYHIKSALSHLREDLQEYLPILMIILFPFEK